jgi:hypothetical protein
MFEKYIGDPSYIKNDPINFSNVHVNLKKYIIKYKELDINKPIVREIALNELITD